jgi:polyisoprenoid-binding protein YceI
MTARFASFVVALALIASGVDPFAAASGAEPPALVLASSRITIAGTSNIHAYSATTTAARLVRSHVAAASGPSFWEVAVAPGALEVFELTVPAATLTSGKDGLDKNMHKALKVADHPDITFRVVASRAGATPGTLAMDGRLAIAGVERDVTLAITPRREGSTLTLKGQVDLMMTDFGITPPKAMLGMLKTDPKVTLTFEAVLTSPLT